MKKTVYHSKSIRNRILIFTLSAILGMCLLISVFSYYIFRHYLQNTLIQSTETSLRLVSESMDSSINDVYRLVRYCQTDSSIANYIEHNPNPAPFCLYLLMILLPKSAAETVLIITCRESPLSHRRIICR